MFTSVGFHKILPEHVDDYIENMTICAEASNKEQGCVRYEVLQDTEDATVFCLLQVFRDEAAYQEHQDAEHHRHWMELSGGWRDLSGRRTHDMRYITPEPSR